MEDKKSLSSNNQGFENYNGIFQPSENFSGDRSILQVKQYGRDTLLQLRLHPTSLQKPQNLPELGVIKNKLYLHDITETASNAAGKCMDAINNKKPECCNMKLEHPLLSHHLNRLYSYCYSPHVSNGSYQSVPSKLRPVIHAYCNPLKKHCVPNPQCNKEFNAEEYLWPKHCFTSPDDLWSCYPSQAYSNFIRNKDHIESLPKCKKKLQIIDPVTGKNVLESLIPAQPGERKVCSVDEHFKSPEDYTTALNEEKQTGNNLRKDAFNKEASMYVTGKSTDESSVHLHDNSICSENAKDSDALYKTDFCAESSNITFNPEKVNEFIPTAVTTKKGISINTKDKIETTEKYVSEEKIESKEVKKILDNAPGQNNLEETNAHMDVHTQDACSPQTECNVHLSKESIRKENDSMQDSLRQLRDKVYAVKQEQQKMAILQSFLRYKKYQLEESARNLDEKRIEIANWECNLYNKAKKLQEKEQWLESKNDLLENKAQQLAEKEQHLNEEENKISGDTSFTKNIIEETRLSVNKFSLDNGGDPAWNEIYKNCRNDENSEYSYLRYGSDKSQSPDNATSNLDKKKSDMYSIEELERSIAFIEKMHSSGEISGSNVDNKAELTSSKTIKKKDEKPYEQLGSFKGRRYLPEHIKYWLNKQDKNA